MQTQRPLNRLNKRDHGFSLIEALVTIAVISLLLAILLPAVQSARETSRRMQCANNLRQLGIAIANYESDYATYPFGVGADDDGADSQPSSAGSRRFSLHTQILPYLEQGEVFDQLNFKVAPFYPDTTGDPTYFTGVGPNETAAMVTIRVFLCPSDYNRMSARPWGQTNYRSCNGSSWSGRAGNGMFGQISSIRPKNILDGLSKTAAFSERVRGDDAYNSFDMTSDLFGLAAPWSETTFRQWCQQLTEAEVAGLVIRDSNSGHTWLEGNMNWTRYNHVMPPGGAACKSDLTWNGVAMTVSSRHSGGVNVLLATGDARFVANGVDEAIWRALGTISGGESNSEQL